MTITRMLIASILLTGTASEWAFALTSNPIDPTLPLATHAWTFCAPNATNTGSDFTSCTSSQTVETATLTTVGGTGTAVSDVRTGQLKAKASAQAYFLGSDMIRIGGQAEAKLYDTLTIQGPITGPTPIVLRMALDGSFFTTDSNPNTQGAEVFGNLIGLSEGGGTFGVAGARIIQGNNGGVFLNNSTGSVTTNVNPTTHLFDPADTQFVVSVTFVATPSTRTFSFLANMGAMAGLGFTDPSPDVKESIVDFGNTAQLSVILPEGLSFSSSSGVFLTPVPEPAAAWLIAVALIALWFRTNPMRLRRF